MKYKVSRIITVQLEVPFFVVQPIWKVKTTKRKNGINFNHNITLTYYHCETYNNSSGKESFFQDDFQHNITDWILMYLWTPKKGWERRFYVEFVSHLKSITRLQKIDCRCSSYQKTFQHPQTSCQFKKKVKRFDIYKWGKIERFVIHQWDANVNIKRNVLKSINEMPM